MPFFDRIELNPRVCNGKPVIKGTRIPVSVLLDQIAAGDSWDAIIRGYPELCSEDIQSALLYASAVIEHTEVIKAHA
ncbi:MAG: DUF433 domain-containing protein [Pseudomonadota bacterium]